MPTYEVTVTDDRTGKKYVVKADGPSPADVQAAVEAQLIKSPESFNRPGIGPALKETKPTLFDTPSGRMLNAAGLGLPSLVDAGVKAATTGVQNLTGRGPGYTAADRFDAERLAANARRREMEAKHPVTSLGLDIAGSMLMPGGRTIGAATVGKRVPALVAAGKRVPVSARVGQGVRAATAGGALSAVQGGATADPGREAGDATAAGVTGAVLAPVVGAGISGAGKLAGMARKYTQPRTPDITSAEKLGKVLQKQQLDPAAIDAALAEWNTAGGVTPTMLDILREAGASRATLRLLNESEVTAPVRAAAEKQAREVAGGVQQRALAATDTLQTGEPRTPTVIRGDLAARTGAVDEATAAAIAKVDEDLAAGLKVAPEGPVKPEEGAAAFSQDLNAKYDVSRKAYQEPYDAAMKAPPESAIVDAPEVRPFFERIQRTLADSFNPDLDGVKAVQDYVAKIKEKTAPGDAADWPEGEIMENASDLTVKQLEFMKQKMNSLARKYEGDPGSVAANEVRKYVDSEMSRLLDNGLVIGDPAVVDLWATGNKAYGEHMQRFGSGLSKTLTERKPNGDLVVEPWRAGNVIFGDAKEGAKPLNNVLSDLEEAMSVASPEAKEALKGELYVRLANKPDELARLLKSTGGRELLPRELADLNIAATADNAAAEEAALAAKAAAEADALAAKAPLEAEESALALGEKALSTPSEEFIPATTAIDDALRPLAASGSKQALVNKIEAPGPEDSISATMLGERTTKNLGATLGDEQTGRWQAMLRNVEKNAQNSREMARAVGGADDIGAPLLESTRPGDIVYPKVGASNALLRLMRKMSHLSPEEQLAMLQRLGDPAEGGLEELKASLIRKYPAKSVRATPQTTLGMLSGAEGDDPEAMRRLREAYALE